MNMTQKKHQDEVLDEETLQLLGSATSRIDVSAHRLEQLRDRVMRSVDQDDAATEAAYTTIRGDEGLWLEIAPLVQKKILNVDRLNGIESYLLRLYPGAGMEQHQHEKDELCIVLEGDVTFDGLQLKTGDYHCARKGSWHGRASTVHGAMLFLQSAIAPPMHAPT